MLEANSGSCSSRSCHISSNSDFIAASRAASDCGAACRLGSPGSGCGGGACRCTDFGNVCAEGNGIAREDRRTATEAAAIFFIIRSGKPAASILSECRQAPCQRTANDQRLTSVACCLLPVAYDLLPNPQD